MTVRFGATILQVVPYPLLRDDFVFAESIGLDNAWVIDQFWIDEAPEVPLSEAWTMLAALARETERIRIGAMVTNVATRNPAMLVKSILTVDQVSGGRVEAAVGGGSYPAERAAIGIEPLDGPGRGERLREAVAVLDDALRGNRVTHDGVHLQLADAEAMLDGRMRCAGDSCPGSVSRSACCWAGRPSASSASRPKRRVRPHSRHGRWSSITRPRIWALSPMPGWRPPAIGSPSSTATRHTAVSWSPGPTTCATTWTRLGSLFARRTWSSRRTLHRPPCESARTESGGGTDPSSSSPRGST